MADETRQKRRSRQVRTQAVVRLALRALTLGLVLAWMATIYAFSAEPADVSGELSGGISYKICKNWSSIWNLEWDEEMVLEKAEVIDYPVRKAAHMTEYAILAILVAACVAAWPIRGKRLYFIAILVTILYACTDEFHQLFVPGRAGQLKDVLIDTIGGCFGMLAVLICVKIHIYRHSKI